MRYWAGVGSKRLSSFDASASHISTNCEPRWAVDAPYRKQGGPDITGACNHAWGAWETAREAAGGINKVKSTHPELWQAITAWQRLIHAGRHPGKKLGRLPTESETRFIVGLCVNAVRLLCPTCHSEDAA